MSDLHKPPQGRTIGKIAEHLASIYRVFIAEGLLELQFRDEVLSYTQPRYYVLHTTKRHWKPPRLWRKEIDFDLELDFVHVVLLRLREKASTSHAGFALFRRNRLIQGSGDEGYRPELIFGRPNTFTYQRLFGELHLEGFDVSHTKDGFSGMRTKNRF